MGVRKAVRIALLEPTVYNAPPMYKFMLWNLLTYHFAQFHPALGFPAGAISTGRPDGGGNLQVLFVGAGPKRKASIKKRFNVLEEQMPLADADRPLLRLPVPAAGATAERGMIRICGLLLPIAVSPLVLAQKHTWTFL